MKLKQAFTLIELLVVIAIIAILAAILFPVFAQAKAAAKKTSSLSNVKQLSLSTLMYNGDADDMFVANGEPGPDNGWGWQMTWMVHVQPYMKTYDILRDPSDTHKVVDGTGPRYSYWANGIFGWVNDFDFRGVVNFSRGWTGALEARSGTEITKPAETILFATRTKHLNPAGTLEGAFSPWYGIVTLVDGVDGGQVLPGQRDCWAAPDPAHKGLIDETYQGQSAFAFSDGHAKSMKPVQTVDMSAPGAGCRVDHKFTKMWDALRDY
ncbi:prepilin-type N-terminal cleavage/methylation domain-containing protein [bacterium]|nr:MAG: prepilin-type N-terminal cleavage/methylation domain-containing protein [bacterium]